MLGGALFWHPSNNATRPNRLRTFMSCLLDDSSSWVGISTNRYEVNLPPARRASPLVPPRGVRKGTPWGGYCGEFAGRDGVERSSAMVMRPV